MRAFFKALILLPVALALVLFAIANRHLVKLSLDPLNRDAPFFSFEAPLFAVVLAALALGILIGGFAAWVGQGKHRKARRALGREADRLRAEAEALRAKAQDATLAALPARRG
jgi:uncharacterized integral membrane protein